MNTPYTCNRKGDVDKYYLNGHYFSFYEDKVPADMMLLAAQEMKVLPDGDIRDWDIVEVGNEAVRYNSDEMVSIKTYKMGTLKFVTIPNTPTRACSKT